MDEKDGFFTITGRTGDVINVGGLKFMASEVERVALSYPDVLLVKAYSKRNPITGEHVEMIVQPKTNSSFDVIALKAFLREHLQPHMLPKRVQIEGLNVGHRFKKE